MRNAIAGGLLLAAVMMGPAHAADENLLPKVHRQGDYTYLSGGSDEAQRKAMFKIAAKYPMQLIVSKAGEVVGVTGAKVTLRNVSGDPVLEMVGEGPFIYINPPASGRFTIEVEYEGEKKTVLKDLVGRRYLVLEFKFGAP